jgi:hypothetical protein
MNFANAPFSGSASFAVSSG